MHDVYVGIPDRTRSLPPEFHWEREEKYWHVVAELLDLDGDNTAPRRKICSSSSDSGRYDFVLPPHDAGNDNNKMKTMTKKKHNKKLKQKQRRGSGMKKKTIRIRISTSSAAADEEEEQQRREEKEEEDDDDDVTERSLMFSNSYRRLCKANKNYYDGNTKHNTSGRRRRQMVWNEARGASGWCRGVEGKVRESYVVVKRSDDPRADFRRSMMEMILEKQMFEENDLEQLLICFLSLNSSRHHSVIVQAFVDIWHALFLATRRSSSCSVSGCNDRVSFAV